MRAFVLVACFVAVAVARPDVGGYNYNGLQRPSLHQQQQLPVEHTFSSFGPSGHQTAPPPPPQMSYLAPQATILPQEHQTQHSAPQQPDSYSQAYAHSGLPQEGGYPYAPAATKIHKHIYVHVPPKDFEDEDAITPRVHHQVGPKQKHYKIVFIKAPSAPALRAPIIPPAPQNEEKTLIYVLHKKPETSQDIVIPSPEPTKPSKPEVYFIKYKTKKEEAPVYGPPPSNVMEPRHAEQPSVEYGAPTPTAIGGEELQSGPIELSAPLTTLQPVPEEHTHALVNEAPAEVYGTPTMAAIRVEELPTPTIIAPQPQQPSNQYLAPVEHVEQQQQQPQQHHVPANSYGPPGRFFNKKKK